ncbi:Oidioi.mRNA.OKI2018_I69.chr1.g413.t1.cds [Oikopleura dioica]|uniref:Oidioi.mRNA.OKI2018_I69.chr1.g413.t1.cds n=1 Tax=Oikopleura dioica TaxID=34765 RepID=A0ABN7SK94_OIKDI|nr:Oidioi.mRNA.OKI2018_I69.chr1.g413.t1.cds [Oikopleura dioica]
MLVFIIFNRVFAETKFSIGQEEIRIFENCPNPLELTRYIQISGGQNGLGSNLDLSKEEKSVEICCKPCCECYEAIDCDDVQEVEFSDEKKAEIVDFLKRALTWSFVEEIAIHDSCREFFVLESEIFFYLPKLKEIFLLSRNGRNSLAKFDDSSKKFICAPKAHVLSNQILGAIISENRDFRATEMVIDLHEENLALGQSSSIIEDLQNCAKRLLHVILYKKTTE